jgi:hypothetical protein
MWLFDNIFLDKDTPTRINGWAAIIDIEAPTPQVGWGGSWSWPADTKATKIQAQSSFTPDISGAVDLTMSTSVPGALDEHGVTFDIGGDLDFSLPSVDTAIDASMIISSDTTPPTELVSSSIAMIQGSTAMGGELIVDGAMIPPESAIMIHDEEDMHIVEGSGVEPAIITPEVSPTISEAIVPAVVIDPLASIADTSASAGLFGMLDADMPNEVANTVAVDPVTAVSSTTPIESLTLWEGSIVDTPVEIAAVSDPIFTEKTSIPLDNHHTFDTILSDSIRELERLKERDIELQERLALKLENLNFRQKKLKDEYESRVKELKDELETRIKNNEYDREAWLKENAKSANETARMERVISSLRAEVHPS